MSEFSPPSGTTLPSDTGTASPSAQEGTDRNILSLILGEQGWSGWQEIRVTRGIERFPSEYDISLTELFAPGGTLPANFLPGATCQIKIGADLVFTGYIDRYSATIAPRTHAVRIAGRSKCQDLLDCTVDFPGCQISGTTLLDMAQKLANPFGVSVTAPNGAGPVIPQLNFYQTQTPYELIEEAARYAQMLVYDGTDGNLLLCGVGATQHASGFNQGVNVEEAKIDLNILHRFSDYRALITSTDYLNDYPGVGASFPSSNRLAEAQDTSIRHRVLSFVSEQSSSNLNLAQQRVVWEIARRRGRSQAIRLRCNSWRDTAGVLWQPNALATVNVPALKISNANWLISEVSYLRDATGTPPRWCSCHPTHSVPHRVTSTYSMLRSRPPSPIRHRFRTAVLGSPPTTRGMTKGDSAHASAEPRPRDGRHRPRHDKHGRWKYPGTPGAI